METTGNKDLLTPKTATACMMIHKLTEIVVCNSDRLFSWVESEHCFPSHGPQQKVIDCTYAKTLLKNEIEQMSI